MTYCSLDHHGCPEQADELGVTVDELHRRNLRAFDHWVPPPTPPEPLDTRALWGSPPTGSFARGAAGLPGPRRNARYVAGLRNVRFT